MCTKDDCKWNDLISNNNYNDCENEPNSNNPLANNKLKLKYGVDIPDINYYEKIKWLFDDE